MYKKIYVVGLTFCLMIVATAPAYAHVTLNPREVTTGFQLTTVRVPNERPVGTTEVRLIVPMGAEVRGIQPVPGWTHEIIRDEQPTETDMEDGHSVSEEIEPSIREIIWRGGPLGVNEFIEFPLSVRYPASTTTIAWHAFQTYESGEVVVWDDSADDHPAPKVQVITESRLDTLNTRVQELQNTVSMLEMKKTGKEDTGESSTMMLGLVGTAVGLSLLALVVAVNKKQVDEPMPTKKTRTSSRKT